MDMNTIGEFISKYGFPVLACIVLYIQNNQQRKTFEKQYEQQRKDAEKQHEKHVEIYSGITQGMKELSDLNRAALKNQDGLRDGQGTIKETLIRIESRPCQREVK